jgi:hypothetical protein
MSQFIPRLATAADIAGIQTLQAANLLTNLSAADRQAHGFVTTPFTPAQIQTLIDQRGVFVVESGESADAIAGYAMAGSWAFFGQWPIFEEMVSRFGRFQFQGQTLTVDNSFQYGPVCIDRALRGQGILPLLFEAVRSAMAPRYPIGYTFINQANPRSLAAHSRKLGLEIVDEFEFNGGTFSGLAFATVET